MRGGVLDLLGRRHRDPPAAGLRDAAQVAGADADQRQLALVAAHRAHPPALDDPQGGEVVPREPLRTPGRAHPQGLDVDGRARAHHPPAQGEGEEEHQEPGAAEERDRGDADRDEADGDQRRHRDGPERRRAGRHLVGRSRRRPCRRPPLGAHSCDGASRPGSGRGVPVESTALTPVSGGRRRGRRGRRRRPGRGRTRSGGSSRRRCGSRRWGSGPGPPASARSG